MAEEIQKDQNSELEELKRQRDEYLDGWKRAKADFINYKKDEMRHLEEIAKYGNEDLIKELVSVLDSFDLGLRAMEKAGPVEKGVYMIRSHIEDILKKRGLARMSANVGDEYDPATAEAVAMAESDKPPGTILEEIEPGYKLHDKIIRPARVKVSR